MCPRTVSRSTSPTTRARSFTSHSPRTRAPTAAGTAAYDDAAAAQIAKLGIARFKMDYSTGRIWMTSYGDLSAATTARMTVTITVGGPTWGAFSVSAVFTKTRAGWVLPDSDPQW